ncbi:MAG: hypothetical protein SFX74_08135 [Fimbriimonadaceae bacterium]|nr:hypothetical protein [Fimbriimonadaceae bacterium]
MYRAQYVTSRAAIPGLSPSEAAPVWSTVGSPLADSVLLVRFSCPSCRQAIKRLLLAKRPFALRLAPDRDSYHDAAALLFYRTDSLDIRRELLMQMVQDDSYTTDALQNIEKKVAVMLSPVDRIEDKRRADRLLFQRLHPYALPTQLEIRNGQVHWAPQYSVL